MIWVYLFTKAILQCSTKFFEKDDQICNMENINAHMTWEITTMYGVRMNFRFFLTAYLYDTLQVNFSIVLHNKIDMQAESQMWCDNTIETRRNLPINIVEYVALLIDG